MIDAEKFSRDGWAIADIPDPSVSFELIEAFEGIAGCPLQEIHLHYNDSTIDALRGKMAEFLWKQEYSLKIGNALRPLLKEIIGLDILTQYFPYIRICRPGKPIDCFGFHPDSMFGGITPYEVTAQLSLTPVEESSTLQILSGSHRMPPGSFPVINTPEYEVEYGSVKNLTGYPSGVRRHRVPDGMSMTPVVYHPGQAVIFSATMLLHGMEVNGSDKTRVAVDQHFVNAYSPVNVLMGKVDTGYVPVSCSPLENLIKDYRNAGN
jgi:hypothetical protein